MSQTIFNMLGDVFGIQNYVPPTPNKAHFSLERDGHTYTLDAELQQDQFLLCLSRTLLAHEEDNEDILRAAAHIAQEHPPIKAYHMHNIISFVQSIAANTSMDMLEKALENCIACQDALRKA